MWKRQVKFELRMFIDLIAKVSIICWSLSAQVQPKQITESKHRHQVSGYVRKVSHLDIWYSISGERATACDQPQITSS